MSIDDDTNRGNRGPVIHWEENFLGNWEIEGIGDSGITDGKFHEGLQINGRDYYNQTYTMEIVRLINPELGQKVANEKRMFTNKELTGVIDDLAYGIIRKANDIAELRKWCEIELKNVGQPCDVIMFKCREISDLGVKYVKAFWRLANRIESNQGGKYFWPLILSDAIEKFDRLMYFCDADLAVVPDSYFDGPENETICPPDDEDLLISIPPKQALENALKLLDYVQAVIDERLNTIGTTEPAPDSAMDKRMDEGVRKVVSGVYLSKALMKILPGLAYHYDINTDLLTCDNLHETLSVKFDYENTVKTVQNRIPQFEQLGLIERFGVDREYIRLTDKGRALFPPSS